MKKLLAILFTGFLLFSVNTYSFASTLKYGDGKCVSFEEAMEFVEETSQVKSRGYYTLSQLNSDIYAIFAFDQSGDPVFLTTTVIKIGVSDGGTVAFIAFLNGDCIVGHAFMDTVSLKNIFEILGIVEDIDLSPSPGV